LAPPERERQRERRRARRGGGASGPAGRLETVQKAHFIRWVVALRENPGRCGSERAEAAAITGLRGFGYSWADIAIRLGITRQGAQQRWGETPEPATDSSSTRADGGCP
jgi:hypothetical protein